MAEVVAVSSNSGSEVRREAQIQIALVGPESGAKQLDGLRVMLLLGERWVCRNVARRTFKLVRTSVYKG